MNDNILKKDLFPNFNIKEKSIKKLKEYFSSENLLLKKSDIKKITNWRFGGEYDTDWEKINDDYYLKVTFRGFKKPVNEVQLEELKNKNDDNRIELDMKNAELTIIENDRNKIGEDVYNLNKQKLENDISLLTEKIESNNTEILRIETEIAFKLQNKIIPQKFFDNSILCFSSNFGEVFEIPFICVGGGGSGSEGKIVDGNGYTGSGGCGGGICHGKLNFDVNTTYVVGVGLGGCLRDECFSNINPFIGEVAEIKRKNYLNKGVGGTSGIAKFYQTDGYTETIVMSTGGSEKIPGYGNIISSEYVSEFPNRLTFEYVFNASLNNFKGILGRKIGEEISYSKDFDNSKSYKWEEFDTKNYSGGGESGLLYIDDINSSGWCDELNYSCSSETKNYKKNPGKGGNGQSYADDSDDEYRKLDGSHGTVIFYIKYEYLNISESKKVDDIDFKCENGLNLISIISNPYFEEFEIPFGSGFSQSINFVRPLNWFYKDELKDNISLIKKGNKNYDIDPIIGDYFIEIYTKITSETEQKPYISQLVETNGDLLHTLIINVKNGNTDGYTDAKLGLRIIDNNYNYEILNKVFDSLPNNNKSEWIEKKVIFRATNSMTIYIENSTIPRDNETEWPILLIDSINIYKGMIKGGFSEFDDFKNLIEKPKDCIGTWSECNSECVSTWNLEKIEEVGGDCNFVDKQIKTCKPGEGQCPENKDCNGIFSECNSDCYKKFTIIDEKSGNGVCNYSDGQFVKCDNDECKIKGCPEVKDCPIVQECEKIQDINNNSKDIIDNDEEINGTLGNMGIFFIGLLIGIALYSLSSFMNKKKSRKK